MPVNASGDAAPGTPALGKLMALRVSRSLGKPKQLRLGKLQCQITGRPHVRSSHSQQQINVSGPETNTWKRHESLAYRVVILAGQRIHAQVTVLHRQSQLMAVACLLTRKPRPAQPCFAEAGNIGSSYAAGEGFEPFVHGNTTGHRYLLFQDDLYQRGKAGWSQTNLRNAVFVNCLTQLRVAPRKLLHSPSMGGQVETAASVNELLSRA